MSKVRKHDATAQTIITWFDETKTNMQFDLSSPERTNQGEGIYVRVHASSRLIGHMKTDYKTYFVPIAYPTTDWLAIGLAELENTVGSTPLSFLEESSVLILA